MTSLFIMHSLDLRCRTGPIKFVFTGSSDPASLPSLLFSRTADEKRMLGFHDSAIRCEYEATFALGSPLTSYLAAFREFYPRQSSSLTANATATVTVNSTFNVFNHSIPCSDGNDEINVDVLASADASISLAFALVGTVTPAAITGGAFFTSKSLILHFSYMCVLIRKCRHDRRHRWYHHLIN